MKNVYRYLMLSPLMLLVSHITLAEIKEIPPEEMTEAYIRDTTVIVRQQEISTDEEIKPSVIRVSPLEEGFSEGKDLARTQTELDRPNNRPDSQYLSEHHETELLNQQAYAFRAPSADPLQQSRSEALASASVELEKLTGQKIDLNNPQFPTGIPTSITPPTGTTLSSAPGQFVISIPNNSNYPSRNYRTPGGEYEINITPDTIDLRLTPPQ